MGCQLCTTYVGNVLDSLLGYVQCFVRRYGKDLVSYSIVASFDGSLLVECRSSPFNG